VLSNDGVKILHEGLPFLVCRENPPSLDSREFPRQC
jgi:hypothetical protein